MEIYFTKYIPIEGDIKEGDIALKPGFHVTSYYIDGRDKYMEPYFEDVTAYEIESGVVLKMKLASLFLCSKQKIEIGDRFIFQNETLISPIQISRVGSAMHHPDYWIVGDTDQYNRKLCIKVIGQLSLGAKWLEEKDLLNSTNVAIKGTEPDNYHCLDLILQMQKDPPNMLYYVECPTCGDYH